MVQCPRGHQFDETRNKVCPYCGGLPHEINYAENDANKLCRSAETSSIKRNIINCPNGHLYDASAQKECPYCAGGKAYFTLAVETDGMNTKEFFPSSEGTDTIAGKVITKQYFTSPGDLS